MAYVDPDILEEDWNALGSWNDADDNGGISEIDPAGQLHLDCRSLSADGQASRAQDIGSIGDEFYIEIKFKGDAWDEEVGNPLNFGVEGRVYTTGNYLQYKIGNPSGGDGIYLRKSGGSARVFTKTWDNNWHTVVFRLHDSGSKCDIWVDKDPRTEAADVTDSLIDVSGGTDGDVRCTGLGSVAGNGEYHVELLYIGTALLPVAVPKTQSCIMG